MQPTTPKTRQRLQFRLSHLLLMMLLACVLVAWWADRRRLASDLEESRREVVARESAHEADVARYQEYLEDEGRFRGELQSVLEVQKQIAAEQFARLEVESRMQREELLDRIRQLEERN